MKQTKGTCMKFIIGTMMAYVILLFGSQVHASSAADLSGAILKAVAEEATVKTKTDETNKLALSIDEKDIEITWQCNPEYIGPAIGNPVNSETDKAKDSLFNTISVHNECTKDDKAAYVAKFTALHKYFRFTVIKRDIYEKDHRQKVLKNATFSDTVDYSLSYGSSVNERLDIYVDSSAFNEELRTRKELATQKMREDKEAEEIKKEEERAKYIQAREDADKVDAQRRKTEAEAADKAWREKELRTVADIRVGKAVPTSIDQLTAAHNSANGVKIVLSPKIRPDGKLYSLSGYIHMADGDAPEFIAHLHGADTKYFKAVIKLDRIKRYFFENARINAGFYITGKYTGNVTYNMTSGQVGKAPVFEVVYLYFL